MIERTVVASKIKEFEIEEFVGESLKRVGHSRTTLQRTPLGEKVVVHASRPGLVVGRQGESIKKLTRRLKEDFGLENPQVEVAEIHDIYLDAHIVAEMIADSMERFGTKRFKATMHRSLESVMTAGALGAEIIISGKLPSKRARTWRVYTGHLAKSGDTKELVRVAYTTAELKSGTIGIQVRIMPDVLLPDSVTFKPQQGQPAAVPAAHAPELPAEQTVDAGHSSPEAEAETEAAAIEAAPEVAAHHQEDTTGQVMPAQKEKKAKTPRKPTQKKAAPRSQKTGGEDLTS